MRARGVRVALGGDNSVLGGEEDMLPEMRLCANLHRQLGFETMAPRAEEVLAMATVAGAHAAGFGDTMGRIALGTAADLVLLRHERIRGPFLRPRCRRSTRCCISRVRGCRNCDHRRR